MLKKKKFVNGFASLHIRMLSILKSQKKLHS